MNRKNLKIKPCSKKETELIIKWQRPTLPQLCSTIGAVGLNFSVRNGKRWNPYAIITLINSAKRNTHIVSSGGDFSIPFPLSIQVYQPLCGHEMAGNYTSTVTRIFKIPIMIFRSRVIDMLISIMNNVLGLNLFAWLNPYKDRKNHRLSYVV